MNKSLKFNPPLIPLILSGKKTATWRLFDDKELAVGDIFEIIESGTQKQFGTAKINKVVIKEFQDLQEEDHLGHESYGNLNQILQSYSKMYKTPVTRKTSVKIIRFDLLSE